MAEYSFTARLTHGFASRCEQQVIESFQNISSKELKKCCDKFAERYINHITLNECGEISEASLRRVIRCFSSDLNIRSIQYDILELVLRMSDKEEGIKSPELPKIVSLKKDIPALTPTDFVISHTAMDLHDLLESEVGKETDSRLEIAGRLALWLVLKEAVLSKKTLDAMLNPSKIGWYQIQRCLYFQESDEMHLVSTQTRLWLYQYWRQNNDKKVSSLAAIRHFLKQRHFPVAFSGFRQLVRLAKIEQTLRQSPVHKEIQSGRLAYQPLPVHALYRLITGLPAADTEELDLGQEPQLNQKEQRRWQRATNQSELQLDCSLERQVAIFNLVVNDSFNRALRGQKKGIKHELRQWLKAGQYVKEVPWLWLLIGWVLHLLENGNIKNNLKIVTVKAYGNALLSPFLTEFIDAEPSNISDVLWADKLNTVIDSILVTKQKQYVHYFSRYLEANGIISSDVLDELQTISVKGKVDANLVTPMEINRLSQHLDNQVGEVHTIACLVLCFGFYSGLRRNEIRGLQLRDVQFWHQQCTLYVRLNQVRDLKSPASKRSVPLHALWPLAQLDKLKAYVERRITEGAKSDDVLFVDYALTDRSLMLVTTLLKEVTGDSSVRFHHLRHSFANWVWLALYLKRLKACPDWITFSAGQYADPVWVDALYQALGIKAHSRKKLMVLSELLGHASYQTTLASYIHIQPLLIYFLSESLPTTRSVESIFGKSRGLALENERTWASQSVMTQLGCSCPDVNEQEVKPLSVIKPKHSDAITLYRVWQVVRRFQFDKDAMQVATDLGLHIDAVLKVLMLIDELESTRVGKSSRALTLLAKGQLNQSEIAIIEALITRCDSMPIEGEFASFIESAIRLVDQMTPAKDWLIRTDKIKEAFDFIRMLTALGLTPKHFRLTWYLPPLHDCDDVEAQRKLKATYATMVSRVKEMVSSKNFRCLVTKEYNYRESLFPNTTVSDDGRYLADTRHGHVAVSVVRSRVFKMRGDGGTDIRELTNPRRSKAIPLLLQLVFIWRQLGEKV